jgi:type IV secretory pathway TrbL component
MAAREARDAAIDKVKAKYQPKLDALAAKQRTAQDRIAREQAQASAATTDSAISIGASVLGALFGGRRGSVGKVASAARSVSRTAAQRDDVARAQATATQLGDQRGELERELAEDVAELQARPEPEVETVELKPKKGDTTVTQLSILWR